MPPRMRTQSTSRPVAKLRGGGTGEWVGRGVRGRGPRGDNDESENVRNVLVNGNQVGCSYKEFLVCNPKENDGKGGVVVLTRWIKKMESVLDMSGCSIDQKVKYTGGSFVGKAITWWNYYICTLRREVAVSTSWNDFKFMMIEEFCPSHEMQKLETELWNHAMVEASHATYTDRFHELARLIHGMVAAMEPKTMQKAVQISGALNDTTVSNGSIKKVEKRGNIGEPSKDKNGRDDNKRTRTGNTFAITTNLVRRENTGAWPKCTTCNSYHAPGGPCHTCFNYNRPGHFARDCKVMPRNVNPGHGNQGNQARGRAFMLGAKKSRQDPNIMTGTEPSELGFRYEIEISSGQLVEIDKVIKGCKLEIEGHVFDIDLIPFEHGSFDVIIGVGMCKTFDWDEEHELAFHTLKDKLCNVPILALLDEPEDFVVYCDASRLGLGCVLMQRELFCDFDCEIRYHPGKANVVADALSRKERVKPKRVKAMNMTLQLSIKDMILVAQKEAVDESARLKKGKLAPRFVRPFKIIEKVGLVAYMLDFPEELDGVHDTFHVSNLRKCLADPTLQVPLDEIQVDAKLNFVEEPVEILEREFKKLNRSRIAIVKVWWNSKHGPEFTWEREDQMKLKYPHLFSDVSS
nr:hypothetical protein [Tanacetum cinerariifolium]